MIIDTHLHERTFSGDSRMNLLELVSEARRKGLDGICITDHDQMGLTQYAAKIPSVDKSTQALKACFGTLLRSRRLYYIQ